MRSRRRGRSPLAVIVVIGAVLVFGALAATQNLSGLGVDTASGPALSGVSPVPGPSATGPATPATLPTQAARTTLTALQTREFASSSGYDRVGDFGAAWDDVDRNGCDTRNDILARDLRSVRRAANCKVLSGTFVSPYSGARIAFVKGDRTSELVQIDHVVALADSWRTGAQELSRAQRVQLANDPLELLAVDGVSNDEKGSQDAAAWLPANPGFHCAYVTRQIQVKAKYHLWVTPTERAAMTRVLGSCP